MDHHSNLDYQAIQERILRRFDAQDRSYLTSLLQNVVLFIRKVRGEQLSTEEKLVPPHPQFAHFKHYGGLEAAKTLEYRLRLIDQYQPHDVEYITEILTLEYPTSPLKRFSNLKALILQGLFNDPCIPKYQLAKIVRASPRVLNRELRELRQEYAFQILTTPDLGKFRLLNKIIIFRLQSIKHAEQLEEYFRTHRGFFRFYQLDQDMLRGGIVYRIPNQPDALKMYEEHIRWLHDEYFIESHLIEVHGFQYFFSLTNYNPETNAFSFEPAIVSEAPSSFIEQHQDALPQLKGFNYSEPFWFDCADFLLANTLYARGEMGRPLFKQQLLKQYGITLSMKAIWKKEQRLRAERVAYPIVDIKIPGFDEYITFAVWCPPKSCMTLRSLATFLPYVQFFSTDTGCILNVQRPVHASSLTSQLLRAIYRQPGVSDVILLRYQWRVLSQQPIDDIRRWNVENQRWLLREGDI